MSSFWQFLAREVGCRGCRERLLQLGEELLRIQLPWNSETPAAMVTKKPRRGQGMAGLFRHQLEARDLLGKVTNRCRFRRRQTNPA